ncbi:MAG: response regulator [Lysobacterales bacterium]
MTKIRIAIVEDEPATRAALVQRLAALTQFELLFEADCLQRARAQLRTSAPDVLIVDLGLPDGSGLDLIAELSNQVPAIAVLVLTVFGDEQKLIRAFERGARGYLLKDETAIGLVDAIEQILAGGAPISPAIARFLVRRLVRDQPDCQPPPESQLTAREIDVLRLAAKGYNHAEVAKLLGLSANTVASYTRRVYEKLEVHSRAEALFEAGRMGLIDHGHG